MVGLHRTPGREADRVAGAGFAGFAEFAVGGGGGLLATVESGSAVLHDLRTGAKVARLGSAAKDVSSTAGEGSSRSNVSSLAFSPDGETLMTGDADGQLRAWNLNDALPAAVLGGHSQPVWNTAFSHSGDRVASAADDGTVTVSSVPDGRPRYTIRATRAGGVQMVVFSRDDRLLATASADGRVALWNADGGTLIRQLRGKPDTDAAGVDFSPDGTAVLAAVGARVRTWNVSDGAPIRSFAASDHFEDAVFSPDGRIAGANDDGTVRVWEAATGRRLLTLAPGLGSVLVVAYSHDGRFLAAGTDNGAAVIWDAHTGRQVRVLMSSADRVTVVAFTRDDRHLLAAGDDGTARIWDWRPQTAAIVATSISRGWSVALSENRRWLSMGGQKGSTLLLRCPGCAPLGDLKTTAGRIARPLSPAERRDYLHAGERRSAKPS